MKKLADSNVWLALAINEHPFHVAARGWLDEVTQPDEVLFCRATQRSVLHLLTNAAVFGACEGSHLMNQESWDVYETFMADPRVQFQDEPSGLPSIWKTLSSRQTASPGLWMDA